MKAQLKDQIPDGSTPALILTIANGAAHTRAAEEVARAIQNNHGAGSAVVIDVSDYMSWFARLTHVTLYLWLVSRAPALWELIDRYQKRQEHTSPEWYYRLGCRRLFDLVKSIHPGALVATEVGCCEVAALLKRELKLNVPLVAVNLDHDADRAWIQAEVDLYCVTTDDVLRQMVSHGAPAPQVRVWGVPLHTDFYSSHQPNHERGAVCQMLKIDPALPVILVAGGGEGLGRIELTVSRLLRMNATVNSAGAQIVVLTGRNERLRRRCEKLMESSSGDRLRVLGWTGEVANLMLAADLLISKTGIMFDEAIAAELPIVALEPPPGSERVKYRLLESWGTGRAVRTLDELQEVVVNLLSRPNELSEMRKKCRRRQMPGAAAEIARWLMENSRQSVFAPLSFRKPAVERKEVRYNQAMNGEQTLVTDQPL